MAKRLVLMRHAKSDWSRMNEADHERPLNERGLRDAPTMGQWLFSNQAMPEVILCSSATRALETAEQLFNTCPDAPEPTLAVTNQLYLASCEGLLNVIRKNPIHADCVLVLAHNPGIEVLAQRFASDIEKFSTAAVAVFDFMFNNWSDLQIDSPRNHIATTWPKALR